MLAGFLLVQTIYKDPQNPNLNTVSTQLHLFPFMQLFLIDQLQNRCKLNVMSILLCTQFNAMYMGLFWDLG